MINIGNKKGTVDIIWSDVESSSIEFIHYHNDEKNQMLGVTFRSGDSYVYNNVMMNEVVDMLKSDSVGSFFSKNIRLNHSYTNIGNTNGESPLKKIGITE